MQIGSDLRLLLQAYRKFKKDYPTGCAEVPPVLIPDPESVRWVPKFTQNALIWRTPDLAMSLTARNFFTLALVPSSPSPSKHCTTFMLIPVFVKQEKEITLACGLFRVPVLPIPSISHMSVSKLTGSAAVSDPQEHSSITGRDPVNPGQELLFSAPS